jgi:hypothetical protein
LQHVLLDDGDELRRKVHAQMKGKYVVQFDGQHVGSASGQGCGNGASAGADLDHRAAGQITDRGCDALNGLGVYEEVLAELGFGGHGLF